MPVDYEVRDGIAVITIDRPSRGNSLDYDALLSVAETFRRVESSVECRADGWMPAVLFTRATPDDRATALALSEDHLVVLQMPDAGGEVDRIQALADSVAGCELVGIFERLFQCSKMDRSAALGGAAGIVVVLMNNTEVRQEEEFNLWYDETHLRDVVGAGDFWTGIRYRNVVPTLPKGAARYLAIYETDRADVQAAHAEMAAAVAGKTLWPHIDLVHLGAYARQRANGDDDGR
jgi:hypothetical protein